MTTHKRLLVLVLGTLAGMLLVASAAFACANLTTIKLSTDSAAAGSAVDFRGDAFRDSGERATSDVVVHWASRDGQVLWSGPSVNRTVEGSFTVPSVDPGQYMVVATQFYADTGDPVPGAPARASIQVTGAQASGAAVESTQVRESEAGAAAGQAAAPEQSAAPSESGAAEAAATNASAAPEEAVAPPPAAATQPAPQPAPATVQASPSQTSAPAAVSAPAVPIAPAPQESSQAAAVTTSPPAVAPAARFSGVERAAAMVQQSATPVSQVSEAAARFAAVERAASSVHNPAVTDPQGVWSVLPTTAAAGWSLLAIALAMGAALMATRRRRHSIGRLAVGR